MSRECKHDRRPSFRSLARQEGVSDGDYEVWPGFVSPDRLLVNWYRCRFMSTRNLKDADVNAFLDTLSEKWWWSAAQRLWNYDGASDHSKAY